jgi:hypothetical protein
MDAGFFEFLFDLGLHLLRFSDTSSVEDFDTRIRFVSTTYENNFVSTVKGGAAGGTDRKVCLKASDDNFDVVGDNIAQTSASKRIVLPFVDDYLGR